MGGTTEGTDVLTQWLASRQPVGGGRIAPPTTTEPAHVLERMRAAEQAPALDRTGVPEPTQAREPAQAPEPAQAQQAAPTRPATRPHPLAPRPPDAPPRPDVEFAPRNGTQRVAAALLLLTAAGTAAAGWSAFDQASTTLAGVAAIGGLLTIGLWFLRAASTPPRVRIVGGKLHIDDHGQSHTWDLTAPHLRLQVRGRPGRAGWQVLLLRLDQPPYVVDASVVEPHEFLGYLRSYRPEV